MRQLKISKQVTNRETASLDKYLQEIGRLELITAEEEVELAKRIRLGDHDALDKLTKSNLRFVVSVSKQYQNQGLGLSDLINEGNLGLIKAAQRFDETRGFKFISYAVWWIRQSIMQALAEQSRIVRLPLNRIGAINRINKTFSKLEQQYEREPSAAEIADILEMPTDDINDSLRQNLRHLSMDAPMSTSDDNNGTILDLLESSELARPDAVLTSESLKMEIERALKTLTSREAEILKYYFGLDCQNPLTSEEIAEKFGLTRERVRQIREKAIKRLKTTSKNKILKGYLG
jgi:RNA polymerase primary sigma factor